MMKSKILLLLLLVLQSPLPGAASSSLSAGAGSHKAATGLNLQQPVFTLNQQLKQLAELVVFAARNGHPNLQNNLRLQTTLQQLEQQWQLLFSQRDSRALNKIYNQYQVEIQLLQQQPADASVRNLQQHAKALEHLRLRLLVLTSSCDLSKV